MKKGKPVKAEHREALAALVSTKGLPSVAREMEVNPQTITRILAGLDVYGSTNGALSFYLGRFANVA